MILSEPDFSIEALHRAYLKCRRGKRKAINTREFEVKLFNELAFLSETLKAGTYKPSRSVCFYVNKPKLREIFAAHFRDRVIHRLIVDLLEPHYERKFIEDSFACRKNKGTHKAVIRTKNFVWRVSKEAKAPAYYLQLDIKGYFMQIHKPTLLNILAEEIAPGILLRLLQVGYYFYGFGCEAMGIAQKFQLRVQKLYKLSYFFIRKKTHRFTPNWFSVTMQHCQKNGINVVVIHENEELTPYIKMRLPVLRRTLNKLLQLTLF